MADRVGITASGLKEKCNIEHNCPRHAFHGKNVKDAFKQYSKNAMPVGGLKDNPTLDNDSVSLDSYASATHECKLPSTAFRDSYTCKECGKTYKSTLTGGEGAYFMWEEAVENNSQEECYCKPPSRLFKAYGTVWDCLKCGSQFELSKAGGEIGGKVWRQK